MTSNNTTPSSTPPESPLSELFSIIGSAMAVNIANGDFDSQNLQASQSSQGSQSSLDSHGTLWEAEPGKSKCHSMPISRLKFSKVYDFIYDRTHVPGAIFLATSKERRMAECEAILCRIRYLREYINSSLDSLTDGEEKGKRAYLVAWLDNLAGWLEQFWAKHEMHRWMTLQYGIFLFLETQERVDGKDRIAEIDEILVESDEHVGKCCCEGTSPESARSAHISGDGMLNSICEDDRF